MDSVTIIKGRDAARYSEYRKALAAYDERMDYAKEKLKEADSLSKAYWREKATILRAIEKDTFDTKDLDSLQRHYLDNQHLKDAIVAFKEHLSKKRNDTWISNKLWQAQKRVEVMLGLDYNDRSIPGDDENNITDIGYGNSNISHSLGILDHGTRMAGVIVSSFENKELEGLMDNIEIMPLCVSGLGDENDKDIALAIRYAVDNGAGVINMSSGKYFSVRQEWVQDAIKYAEAKNVLIIASSGNAGLDLDIEENRKYPSDIDNEGFEIADEVI